METITNNILDKLGKYHWLVKFYQREKVVKAQEKKPPIDVIFIIVSIRIQAELV